MYPSSTRVPVARSTGRSTRICSEAGDLVAVGWIERAQGPSRLELVTTVTAKIMTGMPVLVATLTVRDRVEGPVPVASVVVDGILLARSPLVGVHVTPGAGRVFHGSVILSEHFVDGETHDLVASVATRRSAEDDTVPDLAAASSNVVIAQTLRFYAKRFGRPS